QHGVARGLSVLSAVRSGQCVDHARVPFRLDLDQARAGAGRGDRDRPDPGRPRPSRADRAAVGQRRPAREHGGAGGVQCQRMAGGAMTTKLRGVIAPIATAVDDSGEPDCARSTALARFLLANGCDGLNVLGTTGEATSFSLEQRRRVMTAYRDAGVPLDRLMVGTGAASVADAVAL